MLNLSIIIWLTLIAAIAVFWWQSDLVKNEALQLARSHCERLNLQLLDYSLVIKGISPVRDRRGSLCLRRTYRFEFTSTGEARYQGVIVMAGRQLLEIRLDAHLLPGEDS